jgi:septal ring factor EnvC (AmiA/AmiB activator)
MNKALFFILLALCITSAAADADGQTRRQRPTVNKLETKRRAVMEDIEATRLLLKETRSSTKSSFNRLTLLTEQVAARRKVINLINQEIALLDKSLAEMNSELDILKQDLTSTRNKYARSLQLQAHQSEQHKWLFVLSANDFIQSIRRMRYLREYGDWQKRQAAQIIQKQDDINQKQLAMEQKRTEKLMLLSERKIEHHKLEAEEGEQKAEFRSLDKKQKDLQRRLEQKKKRANALDRQIEALIAEEPPEPPPPPPSPPPPRPGGGGKDTAIKEPIGDFASSRGHLPYPLTGKYKIITHFGDHQHPDWKHVQVTNKGIEIQTTSGTEAQAVYGGVVTGIFTISGYNQGVILRHGEYRTVYANLSEVYVKKGDKVTAKQKLGEIFTDRQNDNATILYFEIRKEITELNPELWLLH